MELGVRTDLRESNVRTTEEYLETTWSEGDVSSPYLFSHYEVLPDRAAKTRYDIEDIRSEPLTALASFRVGRRWNRFLLFARGDAGASVLTRQETWDDSNSVICSQAAYRFDMFERGSRAVMLDCYGPYTSGAGMDGGYNITFAAPTAAVAIGGEYHFDKFFLRSELEGRRIFVPSWAGEDTDRLQLGPTFGVRFGLEESGGRIR